VWNLQSGPIVVEDRVIKASGVEKERTGKEN
jgi:hypothetical protein